MSERELGLRRASGITRRELIRRGAVVGGTLLWAAPVVQTLTPAAHAQGSPGPCGCCYCWNGDKQNPSQNARGFRDLVTDNGCVGPLGSPAACAAFCSGDAFGQGPFEFSEQCCGTLCEGNTQNDPGPNGCFCTTP
jgi:hypothetical protein